MIHYENVFKARHSLYARTSDALKENNQVILKYEKNRNTGQLDSLMLNVEYEKMRYTDEGEKSYEGVISSSSVDTGLDFGSISF